MTQSQKRAQHELTQLDLWFKTNKKSQGSEEWNKNFNRSLDLSEIVLDL